MNYNIASNVEVDRKVYNYLLKKRKPLQANKEHIHFLFVENYEHVAFSPFSTDLQRSGGRGPEPNVKPALR